MAMPSRVDKKALEILSTGGQLTSKELADRAYCDPRTAWASLKRLHKGKQVYVCAWQDRPYSRVPVYALGCKKDIRKPPPLTQKQRNRKRLADPEYMINQMMHKRLQRILCKKHTSRVL